MKNFFKTPGLILTNRDATDFKVVRNDFLWKYGTDFVCISLIMIREPNVKMIGACIRRNWIFWWWSSIDTVCNAYFLCKGIQISKTCAANGFFQKKKIVFERIFPTKQINFNAAPALKEEIKISEHNLFHMFSIIIE